MTESSSTAGIQAEWIEDPGRWGELREGWDDLVLGSARPSIFSTWDFLEASWTQFARPLGNRLAIIVFREAGEVVGIAPLQIGEQRRWGLPLRKITVLAAWESDRVPLIYKRDREEAFTRALLGILEERAHLWDYLQLREASPSSVFLRTLREWAASRPGFWLREGGTSISPFVELPASWAEFERGLGSRTLRLLQRWLTRLDARGPWELEVFDQPDRMEDALRLYLELESESWKRAAGQGIGRSERTPDFYRTLLRALSAKGRASVAFLKSADQRIAGRIELRLGTTVYGVQTVYAHAHAKLTPGDTLRALCLRRALWEGAQEYEFLAQFVTHKLRWTRKAWANVDLSLDQLRSIRQRLLLDRRLKEALRRGRRREVSELGDVVLVGD